MWMFVLGLGTGTIAGMMLIALVSAKDPMEEADRVARMRRKALQLETEDKELPDYRKKCQAEGVWMAIEEYYRD